MAITMKAMLLQTMAITTKAMTTTTNTRQLRKRQQQQTSTTIHHMARCEVCIPPREFLRTTTNNKNYHRHRHRRIISYHIIATAAVASRRCMISIMARLSKNYSMGILRTLLSPNPDICAKVLQLARKAVTAGNVKQYPFSLFFFSKFRRPWRELWWN